LPASDGARFVRFWERLSATPAKHISVAAAKEEEGPEQKEEQDKAKESAKRTYFQSVRVAKEVLTDTRVGRAANLRRVKHAVQSIVDTRRSLPEGEFTSFQEFCDTVDWGQVNKRTVEALIKCGAMDSLGERAALLAVLDQAIHAAQNRQRAAQRGQTDLFASLGDAAPALELTIPDVPAVPESTLLQWEKEHLGLYLSSHPLRGFADKIRDGGFIQMAEVTEDAEGQQIDVIGLVDSVRKITTKSNRTMAVIELEDMTGSMEVVFFPDSWDESQELLEVDNAIRVSARVEKRNDSLQLVAQSTAPVDLEPEAPPDPIRLMKSSSVCRRAMIWMLMLSSCADCAEFWRSFPGMTV
jgi:DNA polymerase-3 subunit alpha